MHPQSPVLPVSYPQGVKDPRANFEKLQNSGADEEIVHVIVHNSTHLAVFYLYLIRISTYHYAVHSKIRTDSFYADHYLQLRVLFDVLLRTVTFRNVEIRIACVPILTDTNCAGQCG